MELEQQRTSFPFVDDSLGGEGRLHKTGVLLAGLAVFVLVLILYLMIAKPFV